MKQIILRTPGRKSHAGSWAQRSPMCETDARARPTDQVHLGEVSEVECTTCLERIAELPTGIPGHRLFTTWAIVPANDHDPESDGRCMTGEPQGASAVQDGLRRRHRGFDKAYAGNERARARSEEAALVIQRDLSTKIQAARGDQQRPTKDQIVMFLIGYRQRIINQADSNPYPEGPLAGLWQAGHDAADEDLGL